MIQCLCRSGFYDWKSALNHFFFSNKITSILFLRKLQVTQQINGPRVSELTSKAFAAVSIYLM